jgi:TRAP-type C4-dicarboxylate transport system substrate-binding protein
MKKARMIQVVLIATFVAVWVVGLHLASVQAAVKPTKLKAANVFPPPESSMSSEIFKTWQDEVTKRTKGAITFENFWGCALGTPPEHIDLLKKNTVQVVQTHFWYTPARFPVGHFEYTLPFGPTNYTLVAKAMRKIRAEIPQFVQDESRENAIVVCQAPGGVYDFMSKKPLKKMADFKGEKVSLIGRYFGRWLPPGASAVVRPGHERYDMLRSGVVSTDLLAFDLFYAFKIHEVTQYYIHANLTTACFCPIMVNLEVFKGLSPEVQKIMLQAGEEVELKAAKEILPRWWARCEKEWKAKGITFITIPDEEIKIWASHLEDIPLEWAKEMEGKGIAGFKIIDRWQEITSEMGFKWARKWGVRK